MALECLPHLTGKFSQFSQKCNNSDSYSAGRGYCGDGAELNSILGEVSDGTYTSRAS